jgi:hypothetical protein
MQKQAIPQKHGCRKAKKDSADTYRVRGAGAFWQSDFGMALN